MAYSDDVPAEDRERPVVERESPSGHSAPLRREEESRQFISHFAKYQHAVNAYIRASVPNRTDADDIMQDVSLTLWNKWHTFDPSTNFVRWACAVAFIEILRYRRRAAKNRMWLNEPLLELLSADFQKNAERYTARLDALTTCLEKLSSEDRRLIDVRYREGGTVRGLAEEYGKPLSTVYKMLLRIRESLRRCIDHKIAAQLHPSHRSTS